MRREMFITKLPPATISRASKKVGQCDGQAAFGLECWVDDAKNPAAWGN
jgi:hypothetical protein